MKYGTPTIYSAVQQTLYNPNSIASGVVVKVLYQKTFNGSIVRILSGEFRL